MTPPSAVSAPVAALIELFQVALPEVEFPDVDAARLAQLAAALETSAQRLAAAEQALADARQAHASAYQALRTAAARGLGYARIYASDDESLLQRLAAIELDESTRRKAPPKRRGKRSRAKTADVTELPLAQPRATG